ncbi:hypothetical protein HY993_03415 [Candidatus Micrarchaeota archaeon]|nr:hypothetical protein [Candidatus Micrarchaeota archaeon]
MTNASITFRGVDREIYRRFKSAAVSKDKQVGEAVNEAMMQWAGKNAEKSAGEDSFFKWASNPVDWGVKTDARKTDEYLAEYYDEKYKKWHEKKVGRK